MRLEARIGRAQLANFFRATPEAYGEPGQVRSAERGGLTDRGTYDGHAKQVGLELHQQVIHGRAAIDAQLAETEPWCLHP